MIRKRHWGLGAVCALVLALGVGGQAQAHWFRAESARFVVYSDGDETVLRSYVSDLEAFDQTLRAIHGLSLTEVPPRKLDIYLVRDNAELREIEPEMGERIYGFYSAGEDDIFAVAIRQRGDNSVMQHEYTHHFMKQYFPYGYPTWLVEGYAEYFMTTSIEGDTVEVGKFGLRAEELIQSDWIPLRTVLGKGLGAVPTEKLSIYYGESWILTHYLMSDPGRYRQLQAYMKAVGEGGDPVAAMEGATGMTVDVLQKTLTAYLHGGLKYVRYKRTGFAAPQVTVTSLPPSADALMLLGQRVKNDVPDAQKADVATRIRTLAARFPGDRLATLTLGRAETRDGDRAAGEHILADWIAQHPDDAEALQILGKSRLAACEAEASRREACFIDAGGYLARAYKLDPNSYQTLFAYVRTRVFDPHYPTDNTLTALMEAHALAPQVGDISVATAQALMMRDRYPQAEALLKPLANDPHGGGLAQVAKQMLGVIAARTAAHPASP